MKRNRGYITVEASLVLPLFLFFMLAMSGIFMVLMAESHVHQSLAAATDYVAEYCYLEQKLLAKDEKKPNSVDAVSIDVESLIDAIIVKQQFSKYIGNDFYVKKVVSGGKSGVFVCIEKDKQNSKIMIVTASYKAKINLPLLGTYSINLSNQIKQKAFVGFTEEEYNNSDYFVYVTPNREAYHMRRDCTHLTLDIDTVSSNRKGNYAPCFYCGIKKGGTKIYIAKHGEVYHNSRGCVGLKRTVRRVKVSSVEGIGACTRCGG